MSKIIRTDANKVLAKAVEYHNFVYLAGMTADDTTQDVTGQTTQVLAAIDAMLETHGTDKTRMLQAQIWLKGHPRPRRHEQGLVGLVARGRCTRPRVRGSQHGRSAAAGRDHGHRLQVSVRSMELHQM